MFEGKTLIGVGCSHVFGQLGEDYDPITCHERSWVKKLERLGNFKNSINLGTPGGSNKRSERVLLDYLKNNDTDDLVVIFSLTELSRHEFPYNKTIDGTTDFIGVCSWMISNDPGAEYWKSSNPKRVYEFLETYYMHFHSDAIDKEEINSKVTMLHTLLQTLNVEHYFFEMICHPGTIDREQFGLKIPMINFKDQLGHRINANSQIYLNGNFRPGTCLHWDHDGNEFFAEYLLKYIKEHYHG